MSFATIFRIAIHFSVGQGDNHYRWGSQLLLLHYAIFMKHLANSLEVNISFTDKTETYTKHRTSKRIALSTSHCDYHILGCFSVSPLQPTLALMGLINEDPFQHVFSGGLCILYVWFRDSS